MSARRAASSSGVLVLLIAIGRLSVGFLSPVRLVITRFAFWVAPVTYMPGDSALLAETGPWPSIFNWAVPACLVGCPVLVLFACSCRFRAAARRALWIAVVGVVSLVIVPAVILRVESEHCYKQVASSAIDKVVVVISDFGIGAGTLDTVLIHSGDLPDIHPRHAGLPFDLEGRPPFAQKARISQLTIQPAELQKLLKEMKQRGFFQLPELLEPKSSVWNHRYRLVGVYGGYYRHEVLTPIEARDAELLNRVIRTISDTVPLEPSSAEVLR